MGRIFLGEELKKKLNRIRPFVKVVRVKGIKGTKYSDIIAFLADYYLKEEAKK